MAVAEPWAGKLPTEPSGPAKSATRPPLALPVGPMLMRTEVLKQLASRGQASSRGNEIMAPSCDALSPQAALWLSKLHKDSSCPSTSSPSIKIPKQAKAHGTPFGLLRSNALLARRTVPRGYLFPYGVV
jgi:hypothetical protein